MPTLAVRVTIGDYAKWRPIFDKNKPLRDKAGLRNVRVYRDADNPQELIVLSETSDLAKAREALSSPEVRNAMQEAGAVGSPKIHVLASGCAELAPGLLGAVTAADASSCKITASLNIAASLMSSPACGVGHPAIE